MAALDELLLALDDYMNNSGVKGTKGTKFLANKLASVFTHKDSPFNMNKGGLMEALGKKINMLVLKVDKLTNSKILDDIFAEFQNLNTHLGHMNIGFAAIANETYSMASEMNSFAQKLKKFDLSKILNVNINGSANAIKTPAFPVQGFLKTFGKMFQHNFSSTFTLHDTNKKDAKGNYVQRQIRAIDVHLVKIRPGTFDDFFVQYQKRFSSTAHEEVLQTPGPKGEKTRVVHAIDVNLIAISEKVLKSIKSNITITKDKSEEGGWFSKIIGTITSGLMFFGGLGGIAYFLEKTAIGKIILEKAKSIISYISDKFSELLKSGMIEEAIKGLSSSIGSLFSYLATGTGDFLKNNKDAIFSIMQTGIFAVFTGVSEFMQSTFSFFGLKEKLGKGGEGTATIATKGIFAGTTKLITAIANKLTFGLFGKAGGVLGGIFKFLPNLLGEWMEKKGASILPALFTQGGSKAFTRILTQAKSFTGIGKLLAKFGLRYGGKLLKAFKVLPFIGTLISWHSAYQRGKSGDYVGMTLDIASGIAALFPGIGTAISIGLDVFNAVLDNKSEKSGLTKGQMIGDFFAPMTKWVKETFSYEKLKNLPVIGGIIRMAEGAKMIWNGDTKNGIKTLFSAIVWMAPIPGLPEILGIVDYFGDDKSGSKQLPSAISSSLNINKFVDSIVSFVSGAVEGFIGMLKKIFSGVFGWYEKYASESKTGEWIGDKLYGNKIAAASSSEIEENRKLAAARRASLQPTKVNDAVIVQPHNKDQILMTKSGGVFDLALKDLIGKMEEEIQLLHEGFSMLASATMAGSGQVTNAIIATANSASTPNAVGGSNRIHDLRDYHSSKIRR